MSMPAGDDEFGETDAEGTFEAEQQLTLADEEEALPWLESDEDYEEEGSDYRIVIFALAAVVALAAILFGVNYLVGDRGNGGGDVVADGSTIEAPDEAYKVRPENPGGSEVAGTGDVSFEVGQGQGREGQLADDTADAPSSAGDAGSSSDSSEAASSSGVGVQVGAFQTRASARAGWNTLRARYSVLQTVNHRIVEGTVDSGTIYRLQAVASDEAAADSLCRSIRNAGGDCQVKR